jgi:GntR family transcriptional regulator
MVIAMEILISNSSDKPIYEQICMQIKERIMNGTLEAGEALPSMRALAKDLHISVITVQRAYEDLTRDGFIETVSGKGSFVAAQNTEFIQEEQLRIAEGLLEKAAQIGRTYGIAYEQMASILKLFYEE